MESEKSRDDLNQAIQNYRENREILLNIQAKTRDAFIQITNILKPSTIDLSECVNLNNLTTVVSDLGGIENQKTNDDHNTKIDVNCHASVENEMNFKQIEIGNPAIMIVGQVKAGKSTLVNALLKKSVVCQAYERCTARLTRLTYSKTTFIELIDADGTVIKRRKLKMSQIPEKYVKLKDKDRNDPMEIRKVIRAGINSQFLKNGIDIIDTPGLNELPVLSRLSKNMARDILPVMIYAIDGRTSVRQSDIADILELKNTVPNLQIIYFITKLDIDDLSEHEIDDPIELANAKMVMAFKKLQYNNLIPTTYNHWSECNYFQGASLYAYIDYCGNKKTPETLFHSKQFSKLESALSFYLLANFENKINEASDTMIHFQMDVLTKIINRVNSLSDLNQENINQIAKMKNFENELYEKIKSLISNSKLNLIQRLMNRLINESGSILNPIGDLEYPISIRIPESGIVIDKYIIEQCQRFIMDILCLGLDNIIKQFVEDELFRKYREEVEDLVTPRMKCEIGLQTARSSGRNPYSMCLKRILIENYKFSFSSNTNNSNAIHKIINIIRKSIKKFLWNKFRIESIKGCVNVKSPIWKKKQAKRFLDKCNQYLLAEEVCKNLIYDIDNKHNDFTEALKIEENFMKKKISISEAIQLEIKNKAPNFTDVLMLTLDVKSRYMLQGVQEIEMIGRGTQYTVYRCSWNGKEIAKKTCELHENKLNSVAEEVYYSYLFEHPRLLPFIGISIKNDIRPNHKLISIYTPLMKTDVLKYLKNNDMSFKDRLKIGLQVAEALQYLHNQQIMHRDLKLENILLDEDNNVYLADYGLCKSTAFCENSLVGTPIHMAPEIIRHSNYSFKIDIYSFAISLWYLAEGNGNHPASARIFSGQYQVLWAAAEHDNRPERLDNISDELWDFICICWDKDAAVRPDIDLVIEKMKQIIDNCLDDR